MNKLQHLKRHVFTKLDDMYKKLLKKASTAQEILASFQISKNTQRLELCAAKQLFPQTDIDQ